MIRSLIIALTLTVAAQVVPNHATAAIATPNRDSSVFYFNQGKDDLIARKYNSAWVDFDKAAHFDPSNVDAQMSMADVCLKMNKISPAIKAYEEVIRLRPGNVETQWKLTHLYFNYGQWTKVIEKMPKAHPVNADAKGWAYMLGKSYFSLEDYGKGLQYLQTTIKEEPANADAFYLIAHMYIKMSNYKTSIPYYERTLALDTVTSYQQRIYEFAQVLATAEQFDESIKWFQKALDNGYKPHDDFYMNMAYTLADAHQTDKALNMMKKMLIRRPLDLEILAGLADINYHTARYNEAIGYWDQMLAIDESNAHVIYQIGTAYLKMGNKKDGQTLCDRAIAMDPSLGVLKHEKKMM